MEKSIRSEIERRRFIRMGVLIDKEEKVVIESGAERIHASMANFSEGGALLTFTDSDAHLPFTDTCNLQFDNGGYPLQLKARIVRREKAQIACEFKDVSPAEIRDIRTKLTRMAIISSRLIIV